LIQAALLIGQAAWNHNVDNHAQSAAPLRATELRHSFPTKLYHLTGLRCCRNLHRYRPFQPLYIKDYSERCARRIYVKNTDQVIAIA